MNTALATPLELDHTEVDYNDDEFDLTQAVVHVTGLQQTIINTIAGTDPNHNYLLTDILEMMDMHTLVMSEKLIQALVSAGHLDESFSVMDKQLAFGRTGIQV